jgi:hypothetical protein
MNHSRLPGDAGLGVRSHAEPEEDRVGRGHATLEAAAGLQFGLQFTPVRPSSSKHAPRI